MEANHPWPCSSSYKASVPCSPIVQRSLATNGFYIKQTIIITKTNDKEAGLLVVVVVVVVLLLCEGMVADQDSRSSTAR